MPFAITVPETVVPLLDTQPIAALVAQAPEHAVAIAFKEITLRAEATVGEHRLHVRAQIQRMMATLSAAELDGWYVDCSSLLSSISHAHEVGSAKIAELIASVRKLVQTAHTARVPGANTLHTYEKRMRDALNGWLNDLDDYRDELKETTRRMKSRGDKAPMTQAGLAYKRAIKDILRVDVEPQTRVDLAGEPEMWFTVPLPPTIRQDRTMRRDIEHRIHSAVRSADEGFVGMVALSDVHPEAFLANAEHMLMSEHTVLDSCASRAIIHAAYYAVFHFVAEKLSISVTGQDAAKHGDVQRMLFCYPGIDPALHQAKLVYKSLRFARNEADYVLSSSVDKDLAHDAVDWAFEVFDAAGILPQRA